VRVTGMVDVSQFGMTNLLSNITFTGLILWGQILKDRFLH
jgi:hypothetical protein